MGFVSWIVVGAIAGYLANMIMGTSEGLGMMIILGIVGGFVGGFIATNVLRIGAADGVNIESILIATVGAIGAVLVADRVLESRGMSRG